MIDLAKQAKNTVCMWYDRDAEEAARFNAETFPDSSLGAVHQAPRDRPSRKKGNVLVVEFTVMEIPCIGLNGGPEFKHNEAFSFQVATADQAETNRYWRQWRAGEHLRLVQGQVGRVMADYAIGSDEGDHASRSGSRQARIRGDDADEEDRYRCN
jgi:predicted 3-demethylubiquinone-9 3-methyltransferase (glyoxalase superfamily)